MNNSAINKIYLDFDEVLAQSIKAVVSVFNERDNANYDYTKVNTWNFENIIPSVDDDTINDIFASKEFWSRLELYDGAMEFVDKYRDKIVIVSIGDIDNQLMKIKWIKHNLGELCMLPVITNLKHRPKRIDKSFINMGKNDIFIEDSAYNLDNSNADFKILFSGLNNFNCEWNKDCKTSDAHFTSWQDISTYVNYIDKLLIENAEK